MGKKSVKKCETASGE